MATTQIESVSVSLKTTEKSPHDVETELNYFENDGSTPPPAIAGQPDTYFPTPAKRTVTIHDIRGNLNEFKLDKQGFQINYFPSQEKEFTDDEKIKSQYYAETEKLLKEVTGAPRVFIFDHTLRRSKDQPGPDTTRQPAKQVHVDQSYQASLNRVSYHLPDEAEALVKGRVQIINVWRPIKTIYKDPLGVADARSVPDSDLVFRTLIYPDRKGEVCLVRPGEQHKWYYAYGQTPEEVLLIKCFDSKTDGRARRAPHSAFANPATEDRAPRESIEVRALVFHPEDTE